ncbi:MAG: PA14 domain-containing protein [Tepidisphaeraceae bacterium]
MWSVDTLEPRSLLAANGLTGTYFNNPDFTGNTFERVDPVLNVDFGKHLSPAPGIDPKTFSVRWSGLIYPQRSETYTFTVRCNDGVRLWIGGSLIIDQWFSRPRDNVYGSIALVGKRLYDVRLEYFDDLRTSAVRLKWATPTMPSEYVPSRLLFAYDTRFAGIADFGQVNDAARGTADLVHSWAPHFIITAGDNNYPDGQASTIDANIGQFYHDYIGNYQGSYGAGSTVNRFFPALGNHEYHTAGAQPHLDYFTLPGNERYYDFVHGPIHFFVVNSDPHEPDGNSPDSVQGQWLHDALAGSTSVYNIVYFHHPPYSSGSRHGSQTFMRWPFKQWGVDAVISGHDHNYERFNVDGLPYFVIGAGAGTRAFGSTVAGSVFRDNSNTGALLIQGNDRRLTFQYEHQDGEVIDTLTIGPRPR